MRGAGSGDRASVAPRTGSPSCSRFVIAAGRPHFASSVWGSVSATPAAMPGAHTWDSGFPSTSAVVRCWATVRLPLVQKEALVSSRRLPRVTGVSSPAPGADRARSPSVGVPGCRLFVVGPRGHRVLPNSGLQTVRSVPRTMFSDMCTESAVPCVGSAADLHAAQKCRVTYFQCFLPRLSNNQVRGPARRLLDAPPASLRLLACVVVRGP